VRRADADGDPGREAGERRERDERRPPAQDPGAGSGEAETDDRGGGEERPVSLRKEVDGEADRPERPRREPGETKRPAGCDEEQREPEAADDPAGPGELGGHGPGTTTTAAE